MDIATGKIRNYVKEKGITIKAISRHTNIAPGALYSSFSGLRPLRADEFLAVCSFLGIDPMKLRQGLREGGRTACGNDNLERESRCEAGKW
ncbi:MAG: helix-turn-helix transcriptional regulator [Oscillospiraceae bacterium]|mgnify:CR=1 FL=1|nr:helix-turn-helix transcriptional regulator [Oscillospiraceae bacterium]